MSTEGQDNDRAIALDLGGTRYRVAVATSDGEIEWRISQPTHLEGGSEAEIDGIFRSIDQAVATLPAGSQLRGIVIGAPGPLDPWEGVLHNPPNLPGWDNMPLKKLFSERYRTNVKVANDANVAGVGEHRYGSGRGYKDVVYVTVSTGIGGGVIADDRLILGHRGFAGELGHMTIDMNGPICNCGNVGCLEALASGTAIAVQARELVLQGAATSLKDLPPGGITAKTVTEAAYKGDEVAIRVMSNAATALGVGMVNVAHLFNPQRIILGGGVSINAGPILWDRMREVVRTLAIPAIQEGLELVPAALGDDAGLLGGIAMAFFG